jgi:hypothetical protein
MLDNVFFAELLDIFDKHHTKLESHLPRQNSFQVHAQSSVHLFIGRKCYVDKLHKILYLTFTVHALQNK